MDEKTVSLAGIYLVHDGNEIHTIHADNWCVSADGLMFERNGSRIAWFLQWRWWKRADS